MPSSSLTELALRAAVNTTSSQSITTGSDPYNDIKNAALQRSQVLVSGSSTLSSMLTQTNLEAAAIAVAVQGLELAYGAIKDQLGHLKEQRLSFDKERQAGIATFVIPTNREESRLSQEEKTIRAFIALAQENPSFASYLGIQKGICTELENADYYSVLPFYRMSDALNQPVASPKSIDKQRIAISLFFKSALPDSIADIDDTFQTENRFIEFFKSAYEKTNYLNDLRSQRFVMICMANLLWNLQHPVDQKTGYPLSTEQCIDLCRSVGLFINNLLNSNERYYINQLSSDNELLCFTRKIEIQVKSLRAAFIEEHLHELNIKDLTNSAHNTLRVMDKSILQLLYTKTNSLTKKQEPDIKAAESLAYSISYLNQLFANNNELIKAFTLLSANAAGTPCLNTPPTTIIDALILFIHSPSEDKEKLYKQLAQCQSDSVIEFTATLKELNQRFVHPIKEVCKKELNTSFLDRKKKEVATLTARRLIPLITLVLDDYRIETDTPESNQQANQSILTTGSQPIYKASDQIQAINKLANKGDGYYVWALSPFVELNTATENALDRLPKYQYRFTEITKLLDSISEIVQNYRNFLQLKSFQDFLIRCLNKIKEDYTEFGRHIDEVDACISKDQSISRNMQGILGPMTKDLTAGLDGFSTAFNSFEHIITAPEFTEQQKNALSSKLDSIAQQYTYLFGEDCGIATINTATPPTGTQSSTQDEAVQTTAPLVETATNTYTTRQTAALRKWTNSCIDALSLHSKLTDKGTLLNNLLGFINAKTAITEQDARHVVNELARITLSYRPSYFFQAAYAETRSSKAFIAGLRDPYLNNIIPVTSFIFGADVTVKNDSDSELIQRLKGIRVSHQWQEQSTTLVCA